MHDHFHGDEPHVAPPDSVTRLHPPVQSFEDLVVVKLSRLVAITTRLGDGWTEEVFGISLNEWRMLGLIQACGAVRASAMAERMLMDKSQLSRLIRTLTGKKLICSMPDKNDARAVAISLTPEGETLCGQILAEAIRRNETVLTSFSAEEVATFMGLLDRMVTHSLSLLEARRSKLGL